MPDTFGPGDRVLRTDDETSSSSPAPGRAPYTGPVLQLSPRIWRVLAPVHHELPGIRPFVLRRIAREIGRQLDNPGGSEQRLTDRITRRYATTTEIRDVGRWLLGAALLRHGCGQPDCETGVLWPTGADCETCALNRQVEAARARRNAELAESARRLEERRQARLQEVVGAEVVDAGPVGPLPPKKTYRDRERASDEEIRAAIAEHGSVAALHIYGHLRALPLLAAPPLSNEPGCDRRTHAQ